MTLTCLTCKKKGFRTLDEMQYHAEEHHSWCIVCKTTFTDAAQVEAHRRERPCTCTFCFRCFSSQVGLEDHLKTSKVHLVKEKGLLEPKSNGWGAGPYFACNICSDQYQQLHQLQHHRRQQHEEFFGTPTSAVPRSRTTTSSGPSPINASVFIGTNATSPSRSRKDDPTARREAFEYVDMVKKQCSDRPHMYSRFLDVVVQLKQDNASASKVINSICAMFYDRPVLLNGFNMFLQTGCRIECLPSAQVVGSENVDETGENAMGGGMRIRLTTPEGTVLRRAEEFADSELAGKTSRKSKKRKEKVIVDKGEKRRKLDIQATQNNPLPVGTNTTLRSATPTSRVSAPNISPSALPSAMNVQKLSTTIMPPPSQTETTPPSPLRDAMKYVAVVKKEFLDQPAVYHQFRAIVKHLQDETMNVPEVMKSVCTLFHARPILLEGFNALLPSGHSIHCQSPVDSTNVNAVRQSEGETNGKVVRIHISTPEGTVPWSSDGEDDAADGLETGRTSQVQKETLPTSGQQIRIHPPQEPLALVTPAITSREPGEGAFANAVKERFGNDLETYQEFLQIMRDYQAKIKDVTAVHLQISHLFRSAPDLLKVFSDLTPLALGEDPPSEQQLTPPTESKPSSKSERRQQKRKHSSSELDLEQSSSLQGSGEVDPLKSAKDTGSAKKTKKRKVADTNDEAATVKKKRARADISGQALPSTPKSVSKPFFCSICNTTIDAFADLAHHLLNSCSYASGSQIPEAQGFSCHTCEKRFSHPQAFEAHLNKKKKHMRVRDRKSKRVPAKKIVPQYDRDHELEYLSTPPRRPASSPANAKRRLEFETPTAPAPRSEPISPTLLEVIGVEDCTMHCRQCDVDFQTVEGLVDHFTEEHGDDTSYCYTCDETFAKPHLLWPHLYTSPRHENAPPESKFEFSSTAYRWEALMTGQRCSGEAPIDMSGANETRKRRISRVKLRPDKPKVESQVVFEDLDQDPFL
ncbi:hypothetical protein QFC20_007633 [Naganishia adeliensis]|uniref:Uncharacterized protein n=1 Tax=Naganishia adeliensis TaxID=92952 RepID=A0ACC2UX70_9TREE|nr:hypothetical protein QFC20_007633 [Naganishia adeliensis]